MQKLTYEKFRGLDNIITIDLHNGYSIIAISAWQSDTENYDVQLMLKENTVDKWDLIEKAEHLIFNVAENSVNRAILKKVSKLLEDGFFDYYITRYKHELACANKGFELFERGCNDLK